MKLLEMNFKTRESSPYRYVWLFKGIQ